MRSRRLHIRPRHDSDFTPNALLMVSGIILVLFGVVSYEILQIDLLMGVGVFGAVLIVGGLVV